MILPSDLKCWRRWGGARAADLAGNSMEASTSSRFGTRTMPMDSDMTWVAFTRHVFKNLFIFNYFRAWRTTSGLRTSRNLTVFSRTSMETRPPTAPMKPQLRSQRRQSLWKKDQKLKARTCTSTVKKTLQIFSERRRWKKLNLNSKKQLR